MWKPFFVITLLTLTACASQPPDAISRVPPGDPGLTWVRADIDRNIGTQVRWGGVISQVENRPDATWVEIVRFELRDNGRPDTASLSDGRFIASFAGFVDPIVYKAGRSLTVLGTVTGKTRRPIGEYEYNFPVVRVEGAHLWNKEAPRQSPAYGPYPPPWWYYDMHFHYGRLHRWHRH